MMKNTRILGLFILLMAGNVYGQTRLAFEALTFVKDIAYYKNKPYTGTTTSVYDDKTRAEEVNWKNGLLDGLKTEFYNGAGVHAKYFFKEGKRNGPFEIFFKNGQTESKGYYIDDQLDGEILGYYPRGNIRYTHTYDHGVENGISKTWFENGVLQQEGTVLIGKVHGTLKSYYEDSSIRSEIVYHLGTRNGKAYKWHTTGCLGEESYYKMGILDSVYRLYDNLLCQLLQEVNYKKGKKFGVSMSFTQLGDTVSLETYEYDQLHGPWVLYQDKKREAFGNYVKGEKDGFWYTGLVSDFQHCEGAYDMGVQVGKWMYFDHKKRKLAMRIYDDNGKIVKQKVYRKIE